MKGNDKGLKVLVVILLVVIVILGGYIVYDKTLKEVDNNVVDKDSGKKDDVIGKMEYKNYEKIDDDIGLKTSYTFEKQENYVRSIPIEDTYAIIDGNMYGSDSSKFFILNDKKVYYSSWQGSNLSSDNVTTGVISNLETKLLDGGLNNVVRVKIVTGMTTGVGCNVFLITEDGKVYYVDNKFEVNLLEEFGDYKVDDILEFNLRVPGGYEYKVVLQDGTIFTKNISELNNKE